MSTARWRTSAQWRGITTALSLIALFAGGGLLYATWAAAAHARGVALAWLVAGVPAVYLGLFAGITAMWFAIAWVFRAPRPAEARLGFAQSVRLFLDEWITLLGSGLRMGFAWWFMRDPPPHSANAPVLLVHGVLCNAGVWIGMRRALERFGIGPLYTLSLGPPLASIDAFADQLAQRIDAIVAQTGAPCVSLVGHSMGGIVARAYLNRHGSARIARLVTIGTPHAGSVHAWLFPGTSLAQLRPGNAWLSALNAAPLPPIPIVSIWSWHDSMVAPQTSSVLPGAHNIALKGVGHNALLRNDDVTRLVVDALAGTALAQTAQRHDERRGVATYQ